MPAGSDFDFACFGCGTLYVTATTGHKYVCSVIPRDQLRAVNVHGRLPLWATIKDSVYLSDRCASGTLESIHS